MAENWVVRAIIGSTIGTVPQNSRFMRYYFETEKEPLKGINSNQLTNFKNFLIKPLFLPNTLVNLLLPK